jgi:hypothetical protein
MTVMTFVGKFEKIFENLNLQRCVSKSSTTNAYAPSALGPSWQQLREDMSRSI